MRVYGFAVLLTFRFRENAGLDFSGIGAVLMNELFYKLNILFFCYNECIVFLLRLQK